MNGVNKFAQLDYMHLTNTKSSLISTSAYWLFIALLTFTFTLSVNKKVHSENSPLIKKIELKGNKKITDSTILSKMQSREGLEFSKRSVQNDIKTLYKIGYFDDIRVEIESFEGGVSLIYFLSEKPTIINIDFQGNEEFENDELREQITLTAGAVANLSLITDNAIKLVNYYHSEGYWLVKVFPIINDSADGSASVTYQIEEGPKVTIAGITIEGNNNISDSDIKDVMQTKKWWLFSFFTSSGVYKAEQLKADILRIKELYQSRGYLFITVSEPEVTLSEDKEELFISLSLSEGDQFSIGKLTIKGNSAISEEKLYENLELSEGNIFNRTALRSDIDNIIDMYMNKGYARADVNPLVDVNKTERTADIVLSITEGGIFRVGRIDISGNFKTRDKVIRREIRLDEGDIFNKSLLKRSYQRINNLNYFENVDIKPTPKVKEQLMNLDVDVEEKMTGMLSIGGGYSSLDKFMVMGEITQTNLFGRGLYLKFKADFSARRANYNLSLRDPWFMNKPISASVSVFNEEIDYEEYDKKATGGSIGFGKELTEYIGGNISYKVEQVKITNIADNASALISDQEGSNLSSSIMPSIWRDTRDNYIDPTEGSKNALYLTFAGLGGDVHFHKAVFDSLWYFPIVWDTTLGIRGRYGYANGHNNKDVPLYERFYVGGINTIRGLGFGEGGPINIQGEKIGGNEELIFNFEFIFPIVEDVKLKGVIFYDYGGAFDGSEGVSIALDNMRQTAGAGVRWMSPFGPIRLEWGFNLEPKEGEGDKKLEFTMGGVF